MNATQPKKAAGRTDLAKKVVTDTDTDIKHETKKLKVGRKSGLPGNHGKSEVWDYFEKILDEETKKYTGVSVCVFCETKIIAPSTSGTNKLWNHIKICKKFPRDKVIKDQSLIAIIGGQTSNWRFDQDTCRKFLAEMIITCELPFSIVEKLGFKRFCGVMQPKFNVIGRTTVTMDCLKIYHQEKKKLKDYLKLKSTRVCITTDLWTSIQNLGYMVVTAHFVGNDWTLKKKILNFRVVPHPHHGEALAKAIECCLLEWGIEKVMTITLDNAKNNDTCVVDLKTRLNKRYMLLLGGECLHVRCFAHVINLVVRDGIEEINETIKKLRRSVKYVRGSPSRMQLFKKCALEENITTKRIVCLDVKTRWNSTYLMIDAALGFERAFDRILEQDPFFEKECNEEGLMERIDWIKMSSLHMFLADFYNLTKRISGSHYITSNTYFDEVTQVKDLLMLHVHSSDIFLSAMAKKMNIKFEKYCNIESLNLILIAAIVLDPRYKMEYIAYWYGGYLDSDLLLTEKEKKEKVDAFVDKSRDLMSRVYIHYKLEAKDAVILSNSIGVSNEGEKILKLSKKDEFRNSLKRKEYVDSLNDLDRYLSEGVEDDTSAFNVLAWWKEKHATYRVLSIMAREVLSIPVTSVASESAFSTAGRVLDPFRSSLTPTVVESLVCAQDWLRDPMETDYTVEEELENLEEITTVVAQDLKALSLE